jgi:hypothetical protein
MTWVDIGVQTGKAPSSGSVPVVQAADSEVFVDDFDVINVLNEIRQFCAALAGTKGVLADLRVTPVGSVTIGSGALSTINNVTTVGTVTNQAQMGGFGTNAAVSNWANQTAVQSFIQNIAR